MLPGSGSLTGYGPRKLGVFTADKDADGTTKGLPFNQFRMKVYTEIDSSVCPSALDTTTLPNDYMFHNMLLQDWNTFRLRTAAVLNNTTLSRSDQKDTMEKVNTKGKEIVNLLCASVEGSAA